MARTFKDMIVQEADGKPRLTFRNRQGAAVLEDVAVEVSSTVQQQGDAWGALAANLLLELDDDGGRVTLGPKGELTMQRGRLPRERAKEEE